MKDQEIIINNQKLQLEEQKKQLNVLEEQVDDQVNRCMRNNIVIKGIEEVENETWDTTKKLLTKYLTYLQPEECDDNTSL